VPGAAAPPPDRALPARGPWPSVREAIDRPGWRFGALATLGFALVLLQTVRGTNETFDFWEHAATVHQLILHPTNPGNALLAIHAPSAFFSPYALLVAVGAKLTGAGPVHALAAAGLINYWLLIAGIWWFTRVFSKQRQAPFYALLFVWLLWGVSPWKYSGFFNLRALSAVIAYPATFATAIGMLVAALWQRTLRRRARSRWPAAGLCALGIAVVVLTHPVAGVATAAAVVAISLTVPDRGRSLTMLLVVAAAAVLLCVAWPYYSVFRLLNDQGVYDPSNSVMYGSWVEHVFPVFAALGLFFWRTGTLHRARLGLFCAPLVAIYIYGGLSLHYSDGRVISYIVIGAQVGLADLAASFERPLLTRLRAPSIAVAAGAIALLVIAELYNMRGGLKGSLPGTGSEPAVYASYHTAVDGLPADATIAAPLNDGAEAAIPAYAGRLIATHRPLAFVTDQVRRQQLVYEFFSAQATNGYRRELIRRYRVRYIVVPAEQGTLEGQLSQLGPVIRRGKAFDTIAVAV
jgi:alpha-1,6-mannosyltransferase